MRYERAKPFSNGTEYEIFRHNYCENGCIHHVEGGDGFPDLATALLEVSKHFDEGALKYGENNWQKGIPESSYIDSAVRHYLKWLRMDDDEQHDRAFVWNIMCLIWTHEHITDKPATDKRCVETDCYFNDDYCFCTSHNESCNPARGKECAGYSAD